MHFTMSKILTNFTEMHHPSDARFIIIINKYHIVFAICIYLSYIYLLIYIIIFYKYMYINIINFSLSQYI